MRSFLTTVIIVLGFVSSPAFAKDRLKLDTTIIKSNTEMPQIVYIIPWKDFKQKQQKEQTLVLHSLFGNLFDPVRNLPQTKKQ